MAKQLKDNVWMRLPKQVTFQFLTKCREWSGPRGGPLHLTL